MEYISIQEAIKKEEGEVAIRGWVYRERGSNKFKFVVMRDHSGIIQCVLKKEKFEKQWDQIDKISVESSLKIHGTIRADERAPTGFEIEVSKLHIQQIAEPFPITKDQSAEFLLDIRHLSLRTRRMTTILKIRSTMVGAIHKFFRGRGYYEFDAPILQPSQCEGGSTLFAVKYYDTEIFLAQSWQLYAEAAIFSLGKIYNMGPTFRAEKSKTSRHLSEFWMAEMEVAWMELPELVQTGKDEIKFLIKEVLEHHEEDLEFLGQDPEKLRKIIVKPWPTLKYDEVLKILKEKEGMDVPWGKDLRTIEENAIMKHFDTPIVVTHYPKETMAFYKMEDKEDPGRALCMDMLAPEEYGEIIGGSQRDTSIEDMSKMLKKEGEDLNNYEWYFDLRRYGSVPHSGYGVGVERVLAWICALDNIKDAIPFPRTMLRWKP